MALLGTARRAGQRLASALGQRAQLVAASGAGSCEPSCRACSCSTHDQQHISRHSTTILCVRKGDQVVVIGDGQATEGDFIVKPNVRKVRRIGSGVIGGFAGGAADGITLLERLEGKLEEHPGQLRRAAVELAKQWRQEKTLRMLEAQLIVADATTTLMVVGNGDVLEPHDGVMAIGSGGGYAEAAARALLGVEGSELDAMAVARKAMKIAADCCVYTNHEVSWEVVPEPPGTPPAEAGSLQAPS